MIKILIIAFMYRSWNLKPLFTAPSNGMQPSYQVMFLAFGQ